LEPFDVIIWVCVVVFAVTALLALLDVSGIYNLPNPEHSSALFKALLLEIVIIAVGGFGVYISKLDENPEGKNGNSPVVSSEKTKIPVYKTSRGPVCGVEEYKMGQDAACGATYYTKRSSACGMKKSIHISALGWKSGHKTNYCLGKGYKDGYSGDGTQLCFEWNSCEDESHGVKSYKSCRLEKFGVNKYKECENQAFGIDKYLINE
jgi:hypothetical protein